MDTKEKIEENMLDSSIDEIDKEVLTISRRSSFIFWVETTMDNPISYISKKTLRNYRLIILILLLLNEAVYMTSTLFESLGHHLRFFTCWNQYLDALYFFLCVFVLPAGKTTSNVLRTIQHTLISTQVIVLVGYWLILFPFKIKSGDYSKDRGEFYNLWFFRGFFNHLVPQFGRIFLIFQE